MKAARAEDGIERVGLVGDVLFIRDDLSADLDAVVERQGDIPVEKRWGGINCDELRETGRQGRSWLMWWRWTQISIWIGVGQSLGDVTCVGA